MPGVRMARRLTVAILVVYLASFALPAGLAIGFLAFVVTLQTAFECPGLFLVWMANPLFWAGLRQLYAERWGRAAVLGGVATLAASLLSVPTEDGPMFGFPLRWEFVGYYIWIASVGLLASAGFAGWLTAGYVRLPRFRLGCVLVTVAALAVAFAAARGLPWFARLLFRSPAFGVGAAAAECVSGLIAE